MSRGKEGCLGGIRCVLGQRVEVVGWGCWKAGSLAEVELLLLLWHAAHQGGLGQCDLVGLEWEWVGFLSPAEWERVGEWEWERVFSLKANHPGGDRHHKLRSSPTVRLHSLEAYQRRILSSDELLN